MNPITVLPCADSPVQATRCREALDLPRARAAALGQSAVEAIKQGVYRIRRNLNSPYPTHPRRHQHEYLVLDRR